MMRAVRFPVVALLFTTALLLGVAGIVIMTAAGLIARLGDYIDPDLWAALPTSSTRRRP